MTSKLYSVFVHNLRHRMDDRGMSQKDLAERLGVTAGYVSQLLSGKSRPGLDTLDRLASVLGVNPAELISDFEKAEKSA